MGANHLIVYYPRKRKNIFAAPKRNMKTYCILVVLFASRFACCQSIVEVRQEREMIEALLINESKLDSLADQSINNSYWLKTFDGELQQQYENLKQEKNKWLSTFRFGLTFFSLNTSVNEQNQSVTTAGVLPTLGLSLGIDPEKFINRRSYIREARFNIVRAENQLKHQRRQIKVELTKLFYHYLEALGVLELRLVANQTQREQCAVVEEKFKRGQQPMESMLLAQNAYVLTKEALLKSQLQVRQLQRELMLLTGAEDEQLVTDLKK